MREEPDMKIDDNIKGAMNHYVAEYSLAALGREAKIDKQSVKQYLVGEVDEIEEKYWEKLYKCVESFLPPDENYWPRKKLVSLIKNTISDTGIVPVSNEDNDLSNDELRLVKLYRSLSAKTKKTVIQSTLKTAEDEHEKEKNDDNKIDMEDEFAMLAERVVSSKKNDRPPKTTQLNLAEIFVGKHHSDSKVSG